MALAWRETLNGPEALQTHLESPPSPCPCLLLALGQQTSHGDALFVNIKYPRETTWPWEPLVSHFCGVQRALRQRPDLQKAFSWVQCLVTYE